MDARALKGMQIAATMPLRRDASGWIVPSQTGVGTYRVVPAPTTTFKVARGLVPSPPGIQPWGCNCPDYELRNQPCKHVIAVELTIRRESVDVDGAIVTEELKVTYTQDWAAYNKAQCEEKERFLPMLADLCSTISNPPQGRGRPRLPMSDMAFEAVSKVYAGLSARRFDSDVRENAAKGLTAQDPHFNSVLRYLRSPEMTPVLRGLVELSALPLKAVETDFAADSTGFSTCRFIRWYDHKWGKEQTKREWVKLHAMTGVRTNVVTAVEMSDWRGNDSPYFAPLLATTAAHFALRDVTADKAYSSKANLQAVSDAGGTPFIPFMARKGTRALPPETLPGIETSAWVRMYHLFCYQRDTFLAHYHRRSNVETTFSMIKAKFGDSLRSKSDVGQMNEVLCKVVAHNLCVLIACIHEIGLDVPTFRSSPPLAG
jgi:transposase